jgi:Fur family transcriptional regulator, stress-responsive regulator
MESSGAEAALLRRHGVQVTAQRMAVLRAVSDRPHSTADDIDEDRVGDNHHHLICRTCGRMVDVDCAVGDTPCLTAADDSGYEIEEAEVVYWGRCPECVADQPTSSATSHHKEPAKEEKNRRV